MTTAEVRTDAGTELKAAAMPWPSFKDPPRARVAPAFLHVPRLIPDGAGPLFVSHASPHRSQTSKETASFHFQLCQMVLLCNQIWSRPRTDPKAPSDLMTFPRTLFSLTLPGLASCLTTSRCVPGLELCRESPGLIAAAASSGPEAHSSGSACHFHCTALHFLDIWV